jgi:hypothetical protein
MKVIKPIRNELPDGSVLYKTETCPLTCYSTTAEGFTVKECCFLVASHPSLGIGELGCEEDEC